MTTPEANPSLYKLAHSVSSTAAILDCGRTTIYELVKEKKLEAVKLGGRTLILDASVVPVKLVEFRV